MTFFAFILGALRAGMGRGHAVPMRVCACGGLVVQPRLSGRVGTSMKKHYGPSSVQFRGSTLP